MMTPAAKLRPAMTQPASPQVPMLAAASTAAQSPGRHTHSQPRDSPGIEDWLPGHVLEAIIGFLDRETLCTARLVNKTFCAAASYHICSLTFRKTFQAVSCRRFPRLGRVTVEHWMTWGKLEQVDPSLRDLITTLESRARYSYPFEDRLLFVNETLPQIALMPKLRELDMSLFVLRGALDVGAMTGVLCHCTNLEIFQLAADEVNFSSGLTIASMTSLTELRLVPITIPVIGGGPSRDRSLRPSWSRGFSWLEQATALRNLRVLSIATPSEALPLIGKLTGLTALSWMVTDARSAAYSIAPLTRLTKLKSFGLQDPESESNEVSDSNADIACSLGFGSLANLELQASDSCGNFLTCQTALTRLSLGGNLCNLRHIGALRLEVLQSLVLRRLATVDAEGLSCLSRATRLTHLSIGFYSRMEPAEPDLRLSQGLAGLTQLRSLELNPWSAHPGSRDHAHPEFLDYALALRPLTGLTQLEMRFARLDEEGLHALLAMSDLRVLDLGLTRLPEDLVAQLGVLTNLKTLKSTVCGATILAAVPSVLNPLRHARGWPSVNVPYGKKDDSTWLGPEIRSCTGEVFTNGRFATGIPCVVAVIQCARVRGSSSESALFSGSFRDVLCLFGGARAAGLPWTPYLEKIALGRNGKRRARL